MTQGALYLNVFHAERKSVMLSPKSVMLNLFQHLILRSRNKFGMTDAKIEINDE